VPGVRAAQCHDVYSAERARKSNNAQVLTMGGRVIGPENTKTVLDAWLASEFEGEVRLPRSRRWRRSTAATTP
jgi:ribose 5-phosphate isomerase B